MKMIGKIGKFALMIVIIMIAIYAIKKLSGKYNIPGLSQISEGI
jgi:hypothetical protein